MHVSLPAWRAAIRWTNLASHDLNDVASYDWSKHLIRSSQQMTWTKLLTQVEKHDMHVSMLAWQATIGSNTSSCTTITWTLLTG